jgi:hypothetical protein
LRLDVVTMELRTINMPRAARPAGPVRVGRPVVKPMWLWLLMGADVVAAVWMSVLGPWFDETSRLTSVATLGGHHVLVMVLAVVGFVTLAVMAVCTAGFVMASPGQLVLVAAACVVSLVALSGFVSFVLAALFGRLVVGSLVR